MQIVPVDVSSTLKTLLDELKETCLDTLKLINQLEIEHLSEEQLEEILGELSVSAMHLGMHADFVNEEIDKMD
ncbi:MAG: hypothetical protein AABY42_10835 [Nitrospirota bacterium]